MPLGDVVEDVPDHLLAHLSPLGWERVNLTGDYVWGGLQQGPSENTVRLRPLRTMTEINRNHWLRVSSFSCP